MAQGRAAQGHITGESAPSGLADSQRRELQQYEKIVRFQDAVLSGNHPSIKLPPHLIATAQSSIHPIDGTIKPDAAARQFGNSKSFSANAQQPAVSLGATQPAAGSVAPTAPKLFATGNTEINPILLEKSDDLVKAELQLQRQRLERALREEVDQRRAATKNTAQGEPLADFDLSDVLSKALTLVQASSAPAPAPADENVATNHDTSSDSFDDNTFYSSLHNTPESVLTSRVRNESEETRVPVAPESQNPPPLRKDSAGRNPPAATVPISTASRTNETYSHPENSSRIIQVPGLNMKHHVDGRMLPSGPSQNNSTGQSRSDDSGNMEVDRQDVLNRPIPRQQASNSYLDNHPPSPLMQRRERSPPPQDTYVSPLTAARRPAPVAEQVSNSSRGTPAQVAALRNEPVTATSPESSPPGGKATEKKKTKKKKRKADRQALEAEVVPHIKPEPRSPSPLSAPSYIRPNKRQRYSQQPPNEPDYEEFRYEPQTSNAPHDPYPTRLQRDDRIPIGYERMAVYPQRSASAVGAGGPVYGREYADDRFVSGGPYLAAQPSLVPASHPDHQGRLSSQVRPAEGYARPSWPYQGAYDPRPMSVRPESDAFLTPPRPPPTRIVVDAFGREYIEPQHPTVVRHSAAPPVRADDPQIIYERAAPRALSRRTGVESYEQGGAVYRRPSPPFVPRRVVTQPEYVFQDHRDNRQQEYSARPMPPSNEFVEVMAPPERRHVEEGPREYMARAPSVRPTEPVRYEVSRDYGRIQSIRPNIPVHHYAPSGHPDGRREALQPHGRDLGSRLVEAGVVRQEYSVRPPTERYYDQPMRGGEEIAFIERPREATQEMAYADDARRDVYR
ncbi:hypothetical protein AK830_g10139 [Neonectria ditissima]|uniref:Uncharacterized protein n=1 Tax=Neonectria ditissima TaxID=78410 RepID=A0A0P7BB05_9HYPO|nr:hypothetical protein AK830_g10139 [Neonectria ditissima]